MSISKTVVNRPTTVIIIFLLLIGIGVYAFFDLAIDLYPEINPPVLIIMTTYSGTGPEEIEKLLTRPLESSLSNVSNIEDITSISSEGTSQIIVEFTWGTNMSEAANDVRDKLEFIRDYLPAEADSPMIFKFDPSMIPILFYVVTGNRAPEDIRKIADDIIVPRIEQVEGVSLAGTMGGRERAIRVEIPQSRLEAYNLTLTQISQALLSQNVQVSAGSITDGNKNFLIRTSGEFTDIDQIKNTVIARKSSSPLTTFDPMASRDEDVIRLRDIANVYDGLKDEDSAVFINGRPGVYIIIQKQSGENSVQTADNVKERVKKLAGEIPPDIKLELINDTTKIIRNSLINVTNTLLTGAFLAIFILFIFLRSFKSVIIIGVSIPISVIITLMLMYFFDLTLNIMTLSGLALGIGMLVDNSIVILENIYRYREKGAKHTSAAILGSQEMINAITASTFTTICVFAPVIMFQDQLGIIGEMFKGLSFTIVFSLTASLFVAIALVPVLSSKYLTISSRLENPLKGIWKTLDKKLDGFFKTFDNLYKNALKIVLKKRALTIIIIVALFIGSLFLTILVGFEFIPKLEEDYVELSIELPVGTPLETTKNIMAQIEDTVKREIKGYRNIVVSSGERSFMGFLGASETHKGSITITLPEYSKRIDFASDVKQKMRKHFNDFPSAVFSFPDHRMSGASSPIDIIIKTNDLKKSKKIADKIVELIKANVPGVTEPAMDLKEGLPQIEIFIDRNKAYSLGLNIYTIANEIKANVGGDTRSKFREGGDEYDILLILDPKDRDEILDLEKIFVLNQSGQRIPVSNFAHLERTIGPINIKRENQERVVHVTGGLAKGEKLNEVEFQVRRLIKSEIPPYDDVVIEFSGEFKETMENTFKLLQVFLVAIALVFGVMASQFESFLDPFIIIVTIPLTFIGAIWIYVLTGEPISMFTLIGIIVLAGIVVNNGIVLVDYTNLLRKRGFGIIDACIEAGGNRLRPILMTTLTTILGLLPMAFIKGEGSDLSQPIAKTVVGGLFVGTIFTLFLVPVLYSMFNQMAEKRQLKRYAKRQAQLEYRKKILSEQKKR